jgi:DNA polymerase-1
MTRIPIIDFETEAIVDGTGKAPKPVGVSLWLPGEQPKYMAWGHPEGNNCDEYHAKNAVARVWEEEPVFHNAKFDIGVAEQHWEFAKPKRYHDTMFQIYLYNPLAKTTSLKPSAHTILGIPPEEQDKVKDFVLAQGWTRKPSEAGAFISKCPVSLIEPYANGDTWRTGLLHERLHTEIIEKMWERGYQRELDLMPHMLDAERVGVRINRELLYTDITLYSFYFKQITDQVCVLLGDINLDSGAEVARALLSRGFAKESDFLRTPTGRLSTSKDSLDGALNDGILAKLLRYRGALKTLLGTFMKPWMEMSAHDGHLHPSWNQVKGDDYGTRTGRLSCSNPNLQNVPTEFEDLEVLGYPPLPFMRRYILPDEGQVLIAADYNGQEMRLLAHFAEGRAAEIYRNDPRADFHQIARDIVHDEAGINLKRKPVKIVGFSLIYGAGVPNLAGQLGMVRDIPTVRKIRNAYLQSIPGLEEFIEDASSRPGIRTWGGRWIPKEGPQWGYRLPNHLIQGSAADQTKDSIIEYHKTGATARFLMTVHDENVISSPIEGLKENVEAIKHSMESLPGFDVPFVAEIEYGANWHDLTKYEADQVVVQ